MKRKQKRYTTEKQITDAIDSALEEAAYCLDMAMRNDTQASDAYKAVPPLEKKLNKLAGYKREKMWQDICSLRKAADDCRVQAAALSRRRNRIEQIKLPKLKQALAAFRTGTLAFIDDTGVVA